MEIWKDIPGFETLYQASNFGEIRSLNYHRSGFAKVLKPSIDHGGYLQVILWKNGTKKLCRVHRAVWSAFNGPIPDNMEINHINEDKTDCRLENLNLMTRTENMNWGTQKERSAKSRLNGKCSTPIMQYDLQGNFIREWPSQQEIARVLGYSRGNISQACYGKLSSPYGYIWRFKD